MTCKDSFTDMQEAQIDSLIAVYISSPCLSNICDALSKMNDNELSVLFFYCSQHVLQYLYFGSVS